MHGTALSTEPLAKLDGLLPLNGLFLGQGSGTDYMGRGTEGCLQTSVHGDLFGEGTREQSREEAASGPQPLLGVRGHCHGYC